MSRKTGIDQYLSALSEFPARECFVTGDRICDCGIMNL